MIRVGIDGACWPNRRGYGRFTRELITSLAALDSDLEYTMAVDFDLADAPPLPPGICTVRVPAKRPAQRAAAASGRRALSDLWRATRALSRPQFDVVFFPSAYTYVPVTGPAGVVVVIHDVIPELFPRHVFPSRRSVLFWRLKLLAARRRADLILTVSEASKRGLMRRFGMAASRIAVIPEGSAPIFRPLLPEDRSDAPLPRWHLCERRFLLYVGGISPHKNLGSLVDAFAELRREPAWSEYRLVLVGDYSGDVFHSAYGELREQVTALGLDEAVVFTGYVSDADLVQFYNAAAAFVLPSLWEGFGLPAVEAMACGAPVVAGDRGALPEVVGSAGLLFDPGSPGALHAALERVLGDAELAERLRDAGPRRAARFSWRRAAEETRAALLRVVGCRTR